MENLVSAPSTWLWIIMVDGISYILAAGSFTFLPGLPRPSPKVNICNQYYLGVSFYWNLYGIFILDINLWDTPYFLIEFTCFLTITISTVSTFLVIFLLLLISLCLSLHLDTNILNIYIFLNRSGDEVSKLFKACCIYEVPLTLLIISTF